MNTTKLISLAFCAIVSIASTVFAEDDFGIESASPAVIADPVNPQPGMIFNAYGPVKIGNGRSNEEWLKECHSKLPSAAAMKTGVDKNDKFSMDVAAGLSALSVRWEGFIKCKRATTYTFLFQKKVNWTFDNGYSIRINGRAVKPAAFGETTCDAALKVGWNKIEIVCIFNDKSSPLNISFKPKGSLSDPRPIAPKDLFHDQKPEEDW